MRYRGFWRQFSGGVCVVWLLAACGVPTTGSSTSQTTPLAATPDAAITPAASAGADLEGTTWRLEEYGPADNPIAAVADPPVTAAFEAGGRLGGMAGCNSYFATYTLDGQSFTASGVGSTEMACLDDQRMQQETAFLAALRTATALERTGDRLTIDYDGGRLHFTLLEPVAAPLEGTVWQLETFITGETARSTLAGTTITAVFADGKVGGSAGCNQYSASYTLAGETLEVGEIITTKIACDAAIMAEEEEFLSALRQATSLAISGRQLEVAHPGGALVFRAGEEESS